MLNQSFVHLRMHSEYSLVDGVVQIDALMDRVAAAGMPAVAITDHVNLFALVKFVTAAQKAGIKPIVGVDLLIYEGEGEPPSRLTLLCRSQQGYKNLTRLVTRIYVDGQRLGAPVLNRVWLEGANEGLIALSGGREGDVGRALLAGRQEDAAQRLAFWQQMFPDAYYLELTRTDRPDEEAYIQAAVALAETAGVPVVATNDVRFLDASDYQAHEVRVCINSGHTLDDPRRPHAYSAQQYLRTPEEMAELFADLPEALINSVEIARRCNLHVNLGSSVLPVFPVPEAYTAASYMRELSVRGLERRLVDLLDVNAADFSEQRRVYDERLERELGVIESMGFAGYFLIVADFIQWARDNGVPVGPGRGSGAGSLVAYVLEITDLDPLAYDLLFERFLNPERVSMPDFDVDFCMEGRDRVIDYVAHRYGREKVSQIITFGSMAAKAVIRDVGRVLGHPYGFVDRIAKLIPFELGITLDKALEQEPELGRLYREDEEVQSLIDLAKSLEGLARNAGKHAGGVVIAPFELTDFTPLYCEAGGEGLVTQFDKDDVEAAGLVKFDFLGLRTLTIIDWAVAAINKTRLASGELALDIRRLPLVDAPTFALLKRHETTAIFQLESRGMKDLIKRLQPDCFEDIIALVALFRPGPLQSGMVDDFINRKHGRARVDYPHPALEPILKPTYGVILYQEQVMQIAQVLAGYTLGSADLLRRAMGKKKPEEMAKQREVFVTGAKANGVNEGTATHIFDLMEKFAGYGFNKSHSAAYALLSYQTAYLKTHYPAQFMAAVLSADMDNTDKVVTLVEECERMTLTILPPDVNFSEYAFAAVDIKTIRYGLGAIKGVGLGAIEGITAERRDHGPYKDIYDYCRRVDLRKANRRVTEAMIGAGAMDGLGPNRASLAAWLDSAIKQAEQQISDQTVGQDDLFGMALGDSNASPNDAAVELPLPEWTEAQKLRAEKETLGLYLSGHPITAYETELRGLISGRIADLTADLMPAPESTGRGPRKEATLAGLVVGLRRQAGKRVFITLDDRSGRIEVPVFEEPFQRYKHLINKEALLIVEGNLSFDEYSGGFRLQPKHMMDLDEAREAAAIQLRLYWPENLQGSTAVAELAHQLSPYRGGRCQVTVVHQNDQARTLIALPEEWRVNLTGELWRMLTGWLGSAALEVRYAPMAVKPAFTQKTTSYTKQLNS